MSTFEIIAGSVLALCCIFIIILVIKQDNKGSGLSGAISGGDAGYLGKIKNTADEKMASLTKYLAIALFLITLTVDIVALASGNK